MPNGSAVCSIGTSGTASFDPGPGNVFFIVVANEQGRALWALHGVDRLEPAPQEAATC
jgi:hypothetical protein